MHISKYACDVAKCDLCAIESAVESCDLTEEDFSKWASLENFIMGETKMNFEVGDEVEWCGVRGVVKSLGDAHFSNPILVDFYPNDKARFTDDGKLESWHKEPSLKLIKKKEKLVKRTKYLAIFEDPKGHSKALHMSNSLWDSYALARGEVCVYAPLDNVGAMQVEVEMVE